MRCARGCAAARKVLYCQMDAPATPTVSSLPARVDGWRPDGSERTLGHEGYDRHRLHAGRGAAFSRAAGPRTDPERRHGPDAGEDAQRDRPVLAGSPDEAVVDRLSPAGRADAGDVRRHVRAELRAVEPVTRLP